MILGFDVVPKDAEHAHHRRDAACEPLDQIDGMHPLIHQRATAVEVPRSLPRAVRALIIALSAIPWQMPVNADQFAQLAAVYRRFDAPVQGIQPRLKNTPDLDAGVLHRADELIHALGRDIRGLLHDHVLARIGGLNPQRGVLARFHANVDDLHVIVLKHLFVTRVRLAPVLLGHRPQTIFIHIAHRHQLRARGLCDRPTMVLAHPQSDNAKSQFFCHDILLLKRYGSVSQTRLNVMRRTVANKPKTALDNGRKGRGETGEARGERREGRGKTGEGRGVVVRGQFAM